MSKRRKIKQVRDYTHEELLTWSHLIIDTFTHFYSKRTTSIKWIMIDKLWVITNESSLTPYMAAQVLANVPQDFKYELLVVRPAQHGIYKEHSHDDIMLVPCTILLPIHEAYCGIKNSAYGTIYNTISYYFKDIFCPAVERYIVG